MKTSFKQVLIGALTAMTMFSCVKDNTSVGVDYSNTPVFFNVNSSDFTTKGAHVVSSAQMSGMHILAYDSTYGTEFINTSAIYASGVWSIYNGTVWGDVSQAKFTAVSPCATDSNGITLDADQSDATKTVISYTAPELSENQQDLMVACTEETPTEAGVSLSFKHVLSSVGFKVQGGSSDLVVNSISVKGIKYQGDLTVVNGGTTASSTYTWSLADGDNNKAFYASLEEGVDITSLTGGVMASDGYLMMIPQSVESYAVISVEYEASNGAVWSQEYSFPTGTTWAMGNSYTYNLYFDSVLAEQVVEGDDGSIKQDVDSEGNVYEGDYLVWDYTLLSPSNCYIVNPSTDSDDAGVIYYIPIEERIKEYYEDHCSISSAFTGDNTIEWSTKIMWYDAASNVGGDFVAERATAGFRNSSDYSALKITVPKSIQDGNFSVAVVANGIIVWSWHFWVTDYNPYSTPESTESSVRFTVEGGEVHRYDNAVVFQSGGIYDGLYIMDRNIGAKGDPQISHGGGSGAIFYQWGRKDPLPSPSATFHEDYVPSSDPVFHLALSRLSTTGSTMIASVQNPANIMVGVVYQVGTYQNNTYTNSRDWCYDEKDDEVYGGTIWRDVDVAYTISTEAEGVKKKSLYDPSPWGWRVPISDVGDAFGSSSYYDRTTATSALTLKDDAGNAAAYYPYEGYIYASYNNNSSSSGYGNTTASNSYIYTGTYLYNWYGDLLKGNAYTEFSTTYSNYRYYCCQNYAKAFYALKTATSDITSYYSSSTSDKTAYSPQFKYRAFPVRSVQVTTENPYDSIKSAIKGE